MIFQNYLSPRVDYNRLQSRAPPLSHDRRREINWTMRRRRIGLQLHTTCVQYKRCTQETIAGHRRRRCGRRRRVDRAPRLIITRTDERRKKKINVNDDENRRFVPCFCHGPRPIRPLRNEKKKTIMIKKKLIRKKIFISPANKARVYSSKLDSPWNA